MTASGIDAQLGYVSEVTYGTFATPTRFLEFTEESLKFERERIQSKGIKAGRRTQHRWNAGVQRVTGDIHQEFGPEGAVLWLEHMFGTRNTSGVSDPYTHTYTPGPLDTKSLTIQIGRPQIDGTVIPFNYLGCVFTGWEFTCNVNEYLTLKNSVYGAKEEVADVTNVLATASYPATYNPFVFTSGVITIAASSYDVTKASLQAALNRKIDRHYVRSGGEVPKLALENAIREYSGSLSSDFIDPTAYNRFKNGTEAALVLTFTTSGTRSLAITMNVRFDGETPTIKGAQIPEQVLPYKVTSATSDGAAITAVLKNGDAS